MSGIASSLSSPLLRTPTSIVNALSAGSKSVAVSVATETFPKKALSGALTAGTLATALSITGAGVLYYAGVGTLDATARTVQLQVILDGATVFDATSNSVAGANLGLVAVGAESNASAPTTTYQAVPFNRSCLVKIASSLSETDKIAALFSYALV